MSLVIRTRSPFAAFYTHPRAWGLDVFDRGSGPGYRWRAGNAAYPEVSVRKEEGNLVFAAKVGEIDPGKLDVTVDDGILTIKGEQSREHEVARRGRHWREFSSSSFSHRLALPEGAAWEDAQAALKDGILEVSIAVTEQEPKHIEVKRVETDSASPDAEAGAESAATDSELEESN